MKSNKKNTYKISNMLIGVLMGLILATAGFYAYVTFSASQNPPTNNEFCPPGRHHFSPICH